MSITYKITRYGLLGSPPDEYVVGFLLENTENNKQGYHEAMVPLVSGENKTEAEVCNIAFSGAYDKITGVSGKLEKVATVVGAEFIPPDM